MKIRIIKRIISLLFVVAMAVSTMTVSVESRSAKKGELEYNLEVSTAGSLGTSCDIISIKVNGSYGSTGWNDVSRLGEFKNEKESFIDINVGTIKSITVKNRGVDGWYPEIIKITAGEKTTTIYGGRWVDDKKEVTLSVTDRVAKVNVKTGTDEYSGTDNSVYLNLIDDKGNSTGEKNLSNIHSKANAFECNDRATFYIHIPDDFGELKEIDAHLTNSIDSWNLDYIDVTLDGETKVFFCNDCIYKDIKTLDIFGYLYKVTVQTSNEKYAGTDCDFFLYTYDEKGNKIKEYFLDNNDENNFEKGDTDVFYIVSPQKIDDIKIYLNIRIGTDWHVDYIQLDLMDSNNVAESIKYNYKKWIKPLKPAYSPTGKEVLPVE